jgi:hypothetical protein
MSVMFQPVCGMAARSNWLRQQAQRRRGLAKLMRRFYQSGDVAQLLDLQDR